MLSNINFFLRLSLYMHTIFQQEDHNKNGMPYKLLPSDSNTSCASTFQQRNHSWVVLLLSNSKHALALQQVIAAILTGLAMGSEWMATVEMLHSKFLMPVA